MKNKLDTNYLRMYILSEVSIDCLTTLGLYDEDIEEELMEVSGERNLNLPTG